MTYVEQTSPFDRDSQLRRYEFWRKKLAIGIAINNLPKTVKEHQKKMHMKELTASEAVQKLNRLFSPRFDSDTREKGDLE